MADLKPTLQQVKRANIRRDAADLKRLEQAEEELAWLEHAEFKGLEFGVYAKMDWRGPSAGRVFLVPSSSVDIEMVRQAQRNLIADITAAIGLSDETP
jgi:hypothetical protein